MGALGHWLDDLLPTRDDKEGLPNLPLNHINILVLMSTSLDVVPVVVSGKKKHHLDFISIDVPFVVALMSRNSVFSSSIYIYQVSFFIEYIV